MAAPQSMSFLQSILDALKILRSDPLAMAPEWIDALRALSKAVAGNAPPASINASAWQHLEQEWDALRKTFGEKLPSALQPLTYKLSELSVKTIPPSTVSGLVTYPLVSFNPQNAGNTAVAGLSFQTSASASGQASAVMNADDSAPDWATQLGYELPPAECFFRIGFQGALAGGLAANAAPAWGSVGINASAKTTAHLDYGFNYTSGSYVAHALAHSLEILPAPGELTSMLALSNSSEFCLVNLNVAGNASLKGEVSAGQALVSTLASIGAKPITVGAQLGATFSADWSLDGEYQLSVRQGTGGPIARLSRQTRRSTGGAVDISAEIGVDGVQAALDPLMQNILPTATPLITRLDKLSDLRQMALDAINDALGLNGDSKWDNSLQKLVDLASGGGQAAQAALAKDLKVIITNATSGYLAKGDQALTQAVSDISKRLAAAVPAAAGNAKLGAQLANWSTKLEGRINAATTKLASELTKLAPAAADQVARALNLTGGPAAVDAFIKQLQQGVDSATGKLGAWLDSYEAARDRVAKAIGELQSRKLALDLAYSYRRDSDRATLLEVQFKADTMHAQALYGALWTGQLEKYPLLIGNCHNDNSAVELQSLFKQGQQRSGTFGFSLKVFDLLQANASSTALDKLEISSDGAGTILAARDIASLSSHVGVNGATTDASLTINLEMLALEGAAPPMSAAFKASGEDLKHEDLAKFFEVLEASGVVSKGTGGRVDEFLYGGAAGTPIRVAQASISGNCILDQAAWATLLAATPAQVGEAVRAACVDMLGVAVNKEAERGGMDGSPAQWIQFWLKYTDWTEDKFWSKARISPRSKDFSDRVFDGALDQDIRIPSDKPFEPVPYRTALRRLWEIEKIVSGASDAWKAVENESVLLKNLAALPNQDRNEVYDRMSALSKSIKNGLAKAFQFEIPDPQQPVKISWRFLGLVIGLQRLAAPQLLPSFVTEVSTMDHGEPVARLFV